MFKFTRRNTKMVSFKNLDGHPPQLKKNILCSFRILIEYSLLIQHSIYIKSIYSTVYTLIENIKYFTLMIMNIKNSAIYGDAPKDF